MNGQTVNVNYYKRDRYGRIIGKVLANGADAGLRQIRPGSRGITSNTRVSRMRLTERVMPMWKLRRARRDAACGHCRKPKGCRLGNGVTAARSRLKPHPLSAPRPPAARSHTGREMVSCEETRHYLSACGLTRLDGDGDGVPCEALC